MSRKKVGGLLATLLYLLACVAPQSAYAWGDDGHQAVALIAWTYLSPDVRTKILDLLKKDNESLAMRNGQNTSDSFATQATWADYYRASSGQYGPAYQQTRNWHFVNIEINGGRLEAACPNYANLLPATLAFNGPANDCIVNKIRQFTAELMSPTTLQTERIRALKMVMHLVGDIHQPLHASDDHDAGGNSKQVSFSGMKPGNLHSYWDTAFVRLIADTPKNIADKLIAAITTTKIKQWSKSESNPSTWANESYALAKKVSYGELPNPRHGSAESVTYQLNQAYVNDAREVIEMQLAKAGIRLAAVLNAAFK
ncbi:S1/P1 nuclease [Solimicrobium silvestre]|uniref:S1/P1 Nuclease n=1 Tax=Solimicrobium silvestre TaxID=2099400 RepID=A0A2S9GT95_9BURK|nr:S1/P1 nuclease [Solimicrobium silvestre]PRC90921.1 S1/P1 Nuclease [Solimicrobium silvestre]